ncbi:MAG: hypothetical protein KGJ02_07050 [Verrucomicrobiota bacterium]|nr:hypothetical protein [Verrucomicrobiota bacterium]
MASSTVNFPPKAQIVSYLEQTANRGTLVETTYKKIIDTVAAYFADKKTDAVGVSCGVVKTTFDVEEKFGLAYSTKKNLWANLEKALMDCANGKPIEPKN